MFHNCISQNNKSSWWYQELRLLQVAGSTLSSKQKGQLLKFGCHFSRQMPALVPKITNPPSACWFLPLFHPSYPCKTICINVRWTRRGNYSNRKYSDKHKYWYCSQPASLPHAAPSTCTDRRTGRKTPEQGESGAASPRVSYSVYYLQFQQAEHS